MLAIFHFMMLYLLGKNNLVRAIFASQGKEVRR